MRRPLFIRTAALQVMLLIEPAEGTPYEQPNSLGVLDYGTNIYGQIIQYPALKVDGSGFANWPPVNGGGLVPLDEGEGGGPNYDTHTSVGISEWSITNRGRVPGILQIAFWRLNQDPATDEPVDGVDFDFGPGAWTTGNLPRHLYNSDSEDYDPDTRWGPPGIRWYPAHLRDLAA